MSLIKSILIFWISFFSLVQIVAAQTNLAQEPTKKKNSVEEIFIWKMSDELSLTAAEEKKFSEIQKSLTLKKAQTQSVMQKLSSEIKDNPDLTKAQISAVIKDYKKALTDYNNLSVIEFTKMKSLLGEKRFLNYLAIKQDINTKLKSIVLGDESTKRTKPASAVVLPPPKIIEEK